MKIGAAAKQLNITVQTLRFYENEGLIRSKRTDGGTRYFDEEDMQRLRAIRMLTDLGIPITTVKTLADIRLGNQTGNQASRAVSAQLNDLTDILNRQRQAIDTAVTDIEKTADLLQRCQGCKKSPRRKICAQCEVSDDLDQAQLLGLIWDQSSI
ncbi:MAG: MerR family transcriptional regulator [Gammaproteobacteria bacterium]|nr:MerR family transcriptional regulator [Gammaproteobacteria bacterium]